MRRRHAVIAVAFALLPVSAYLLGSGGPAFTMYAAPVEFRLDVQGLTQTGAPKWIPPTALAYRVPRSAVPYVAGADHFRRTFDVAVLRRHLADLARLSCRLDDTLASVDVVLFERARSTSRETVAHAVCTP